MKLHTCKNCRHKQFNMFYTPIFCRMCGGSAIKSGGFTSLIIALFIVVIFAASVFGQQTEDKPDLSRKAVVYFYSLTAPVTLGRLKKSVYLDDLKIADIRPERYFIVLVEPGRHTFHLHNKKFGGIEKEFEAGKTYYIRIGWTGGGSVKPTGLSSVDEENGAFDIKQIEPIGAENIKNKEIVVLSLEQENNNE